MNDLFDALNSKRTNDTNPCSCGLSNLKPKSLQILTEAIDWVNSFKIYTKTLKENKKNYCFDGLSQSITAIISLWRDLDKDGFKYLLTSRINQDPIENLFSAIRHRCGANSNPTAKEFRVALQQNIFVRLLLRPDDPNCQDDEDQQIILDTTDNESKNNTQCSNTSDTNKTPDLPNEIIEVDAFSDCEMPNDYCNLDECTTETLENNSITYLAGYLSYYCLKKFNCQKCEDDMSISHTDDILVNKNLLLTIFRDYGQSENLPDYLKVPSPAFVDIVKLQLKIFQTHFENIKFNDHVKESLTNLMLKTVNLKYVDWLSKENICYDHRLFIFKHLIKIIYTLKWESRIYQMPKKQKLRNLQHI